jgi:hypothetical protein
MGKDKVEKKDRAEKKEKRAEKDGVHKVKKEKKEKKDKTALVDAVEKEIGSEAMEGLEQTDVAVKGEGEVDAVVDRPIGAVVPFANPLVEDKQAKKVLKSVKKGTCIVFLKFYLSLLLPVRMAGFYRIGSLMLTDRMAAQLFFLYIQIVHTDIQSSSCCQQVSQAWCQGGRQGSPQVSYPRRQRSHRCPQRCCRSRCRYLAHGRHLPHSRPVRGPRHSLRLRYFPS